MVGDTAEYNDSITSAFREMAKRSDQSSLLLVYVDGSLQADFLGNFGWTEASAKCSNSQETVRKVSSRSPVGDRQGFGWTEQASNGN